MVAISVEDPAPYRSILGSRPLGVPIPDPDPASMKKIFVK
jgi:hypothetical protein